ncbi:MAG: hypothetical protein COB17_08455 [Sulfurimonas sp.]|nr:MAG: hypothetical protein COB17_08455 [Sulfurimonas sp.]
MVRLMKFFAYFLFFILMLMYMIPKTSIYHYAEHQLKKFDLIISGEELIDTGFSLQVNNASLSLKSVDMAKVAEMSISIFALYNSINIDNIYLSSMASSFIPLKIQNAKITYSIIDPVNVNAKAYGEFGGINAKFNLVKRLLRLELSPSKIMLKKYQSTLKNFKKSKDGVYIYEKNI